MQKISCGKTYTDCRFSQPASGGPHGEAFLLISDVVKIKYQLGSAQLSVIKCIDEI